MRSVLIASFALLLTALPAGGASWITNSFRPVRGGLIQRGDTMFEVLRVAGQPLDRRIVSNGITIGGIVGLTREQWAYRGGDGIYILTFAGDKVQQLEVIPNR